MLKLDSRASQVATDGKPCFKPQFRVRVVGPDAVYLLSETRNFVLNGRLYARLAPLLDGAHTTDEIADQLGTRSERPAVELAIARLVGRGFVTYDGMHSDPAHAFWSLVGLDPRLAIERLAAATVAVARVGEASPDSLVSALRQLGIEASVQPLEETAESSLVAVVTDDYLRPSLAKTNRRMLDRKQAWMLTKPRGAALWVGPVIVPGRTACWSCLAQRLQANRPIETYVKQRLEDAADFVCTSVGFLPATENAGIQLAATEIAKWLVLRGSVELSRQSSEADDASSPTSLHLLDRMVTLDVVAAETRSHTIVRRPQCSACGTKHDPAREPTPVSIEARKKLFTSDGGHRSCTPEDTLRRFERHLSPVTGIVNAVYPIPYDPQNVVRCYQSVVPFGVASSYRQTTDIQHRRCHGKGKTDRQARASAFCEAIERYSALYAGETEIRQRKRFDELGDDAVHPHRLLMFSDKQYRERDQWNEQHPNQRYWTPPPFDDKSDIDWTPVWSLTKESFRYLPTALCYFAYPASDEQRSCSADSNGIAAGNNIEEAVLQGLLELIERDAFTIWWYNKLERPAVDLSSFNDQFLEDLQVVYGGRRRDLWVLDITSDLGIPSFVALSSRSDDGPELVCLGCGAHVDPHIALLRAVTELNQCTVSTDAVDWSSDSAHTDPVRVRWMRETRISQNPHLAPASDAPAKSLADFAYRPQQDLRVDIDNCVAVLARHGLETLVLDLTKPDIGMSVVRVTIPGLRPWVRRLAPGRLYDVPVALGWLPRRLTECEMNLVPMFL